MEISLGTKYTPMINTKIFIPIFWYVLSCPGGLDHDGRHGRRHLSPSPATSSLLGLLRDVMAGAGRSVVENNRDDLGQLISCVCDLLTQQLCQTPEHRLTSLFNMIDTSLMCWPRPSTCCLPLDCWPLLPRQVEGELHYHAHPATVLQCNWILYTLLLFLKIF